MYSDDLWLDFLFSKKFRMLSVRSKDFYGQSLLFHQLHGHTEVRHAFECKAFFFWWPDKACVEFESLSDFIPNMQLVQQKILPTKILVSLLISGPSWLQYYSNIAKTQTLSVAFFIFFEV